MLDLYTHYKSKVKLCKEGKPGKTAHDVVVDASPVHHVQGVEVHLEAPLPPVLALPWPGLQLEHGHQFAGLGELGGPGVAPVLGVIAVAQLDVELPEHLGSWHPGPGAQGAGAHLLINHLDDGSAL